MRRRDFLGLAAGGAVMASPFFARAQLGVKPEIGYLGFPPFATRPHYLAAFRRGLGEMGFVEGRNIVIAFRSADGKAERLARLAADLVGLKVEVIFAPTPPSALAAKLATSAIPVVFTSGADPVRIGLVTSLNRPGKNLTGFYFLLPELVAKRLGVFQEMLPGTKRVAVLVNPKNASDAQPTVRHATAAARALGLEIEVFNASTAAEIEAAMAAIGSWRADALFIGPDPFFEGREMQPVFAAARKSLPTSAFARSLAEAGCLMSYGPDISDAYRQAGVYVGRILKGEKPGDLPVQQPTKFELIINLATAKALSKKIPESLLQRADELIQ